MGTHKLAICYYCIHAYMQNCYKKNNIENHFLHAQGQCKVLYISVLYQCQWQI